MFSQLTTASCILCHASLQDEQQPLCLCQHCLNDLPVITHSCPQCGNALKTDIHGLCGRCQTHPPVIDKTFSLFHYKPPMNYLIKQLKFNHSIITADLLGKLMAEAIIQQNTTCPEALIATPLHTKRLRQRGYNQAIEIAKPLAKKLNIPLLTDTLIRNKHNRPQTECSAKERKTNLRNSFSCVSPLSYSSIAIIDDVISTGTTVNEIAKVLKKNGAKTVFAWSCTHS